MKSQRFLCLLFALFLVLPTVLMISFPVADFSPIENRMLSSFPTFSLEGITDGSYFAGLGKFYADRFPFRKNLLQIKSTCELLSGKRQNGNVLFGRDFYQIKRLENCDREMLAQNKQASEAIAAHLLAWDKPVVTLYAPRAIDVLSAKLPKGYPKEAADAPWEILTPSPLTVILAEKAARGEAVWYRTDHHWTTLGAYYAYEFLGESLGYTPLPKNSFREEIAKEDFLGTSASASLFPIKKTDRIIRYRFEGDEDFTVTDLSTGEELQGFYRDEKLNSADPYASFLGGNFSHLRVTKSGTENRPLLLVIKDSYANCLVPFLARHFDIELLDTRYIRGASYEMLNEIAECKEYAGTLLLWNAETLCSDAGLLPFIA